MLLLAGIACLVLFMVVGTATTWAAWARARRVAALPAVAARAGLRYSEVDPLNSAAVPFALFRRGDGRRVQHVMWREAPGHPRVFEYGYYTLHRNKRGDTYQRWRWCTCALVQHNGKWPELRVTRERLVDRAARGLGVQDIELESEEFNRTYVVQCEDAKFATDLLDPQMMEFILRSRGLVELHTKGRFLLLATSQVDHHGMVGLLGMAEGIVDHVPPLVWELYGRFPEGLGTHEMPPPPVSEPPTPGGLLGEHTRPERRPYEFAPAPSLRDAADPWDPTPGVDHDLDGDPIPARDEDPWRDGHR